jgi:hypothetical protein
MGRYDEDEIFFKPPRDRKAFIAEELARLVTPDNADPPAVKARKDREAAERLRRHDELFQVWPGCTIGVPWSVGDPEGDADVA